MDLGEHVEGKAEKSAKSKTVGSALSTRKPGIEWDGEVPHFGKRTLPSGEQRWVVVKRPAGGAKLVTVTLGRVDAIPRRKAVTLAYEAIAQLAAGANPNAAKREARAAERAAKAAQSHSFLSVGRSYIRRCEERGRRPITIAEYGRMLRGDDLVPWHGRPIAGISHGDIVKLVEGVRARAPVMANRLLEFISAVFKHGVHKGALASDPIKILDRGEVRHRERPRKRTLVNPYTGDLLELLAVWRAVETIQPEHDPVRALVKLLILTGARVGVFARAHPGQERALTWRMVKDLKKLEHARLEIPAELRKTGERDGEEHVIPLVPAAAAILDGLAKVGEDAPVFTVDGKTPLKVTDQLRDRLRDLADKTAGEKIERWTPHDLRRSVATGLGHLGTPHAVIDEILDHAGEAKAGIRGTYDRSRRVALCREWLQKWADHLTAALARGAV